MLKKIFPVLILATIIISAVGSFVVVNPKNSANFILDSDKMLARVRDDEKIKCPTKPKDKVHVVESKKFGKMVAKVITSVFDFTSNPATCVLKKVENVCHFKIVTKKDGVTKNFFGNALDIAALSLAPQAIVSKVKLVKSASDTASIVYNICRSATKHEDAEPNYSRPNTEFVDCGEDCLKP